MFAQTGSMFGSGFGSIAASSASAFGAQPATGFGGTPAFGGQTGSSFGGAFGQSAPALGGGGLFGTPQPQQQQSVFGQPAGGTSVFGAAASQPLFGQPQQAASAFGATPAAGGFGGMQPPQQQQQQQQQQPQQVNPQYGYPTTGQGSRVVPFQPEVVKVADQTQQFRHISSMSQYSDKSAEELRFEDYMNNCKGQAGGQPYPSVHPSKMPGAAASTGSAFGSNAGSAFGGTTGFGPGFGQTQSAFGAPASSASAFGTPAASGLFGGASSSPSLFGNQPASQPSVFGGASNTGFGGNTAFGASSQPAFGAFGQQQQQQQPVAPAFGAASTPSMFGTPQQAQQQPSPFGSKPAGGLFGTNQAQPGPVFGGTATSSGGLFGTGAASQSMFGQPASAPSLFGQAKPATGFGAAAQPASPFGQANTGASLFGTAASASSLFGGASSSSLFGGAKPASSPSLFGGAASAPAGGLFGQPAQGGTAFKPPTPTGGLFGSGPSLFGQSPTTTSSLFGGASTPAAGAPLFGASSASLFGGAASSPSLFNPQSQSSLFGGGALFPQNTGATAAPPVSPAVPGQSPYGVLPAVPSMPDMKTGIAASNVSRSVNVPPPVLFRPKPRVATPVRAVQTSNTPASTDTQRQLGKKSPSIFKVSYRDPGLVIHTPLPSTSACTSPPAASDAVPVSPAFVSPPARAGPSGITSGTPEIQPMNGRSTATAKTVPPPAATPAVSPVLPDVPPGLRGAPSSSLPSSLPTPAPDAPPAVQLPKLPERWWMKPSMDDLAAKAARDPSALKSVDRFTIGQTGIGSIMFLEDVDLSAIDDLEDVFSFEPGAISAYYDGGKLPKPPQGSGVNQPARVQIELTGKQMNKIIDRTESRSSEEYLSQLKLRLKALGAGTDATFVDLQVKGSKRATWIFEVKHWSRYGLPKQYCEDEESSDEEMDLLPWPGDSRENRENQRHANAQAQPQPLLQRTRLPPAGHTKGADNPEISRAPRPVDSYLFESGDNASEGTELGAESDVVATPVPAHGGALTRPLQPLYERFPTSMSNLSPPLPAEQALATPPSAHVASRGGLVGSMDAVGAPLSTGESKTMWERPVQLLKLVSHSANPDGSPHLAPLGVWEATAPLSRQTGTDCSVLTDMAAVMSCTKRACISPQGMVAHVAHRVTGTQVRSAVTLRKLQPGAIFLKPSRAGATTSKQPTAAAVCDTLRQRTEKLLDVHCQHSKLSRAAIELQPGSVAARAHRRQPDEAGDVDMCASPAAEDAVGTSSSAPGLPHLEFHCNSDSMPCKALQDACNSCLETSNNTKAQHAIDSAPLLSSTSGALGRTFMMVQRLFCALEPADGQPLHTAGVEGNTGALLSVQRKRELTAWLEEHVDSEVASALQQIGNCQDRRQAAIVELLSANDAQAAAAVAAHSGLPRLSTLLTSGGLTPAATEFISQQISAPGGAPSWDMFRFFDREQPLMPPGIAATYKLLAGDVQAALNFLAPRSPTWQRAFAMWLWFGTPPEQPTAAALACFNRMLRESQGQFPLPLPAHLAPSPGSATVHSFTADVQFALLHLAAREHIVLGQQGASLLRQLVRTRGYSPDVLDAVGPWIVLCLLLAVNEVPLDRNDRSQLEDVFAQLTVDCAATLMWLGLPTWALYVLCHLQVSDEESSAAKEQLMQRVLDVSCARDSKRQAAGINRAWLKEWCSVGDYQLARADALQALATFDNSSRGKALIDADLWEEGLCFMSTVAAPEHLSWKRSLEFGSWLASCPYSSGSDMEIIREFMHLKVAVEERVEQGLPECVVSEEERAIALSILQHVCGRLGRSDAPLRRSFEQKAMLSNMAQCLSLWLLAGAPGSVSVMNAAEQNMALKHMPASTQSLHAVVLGAES